MADPAERRDKVDEAGSRAVLRLAEGAQRRPRRCMQPQSRRRADGCIRRVIAIRGCSLLARDQIRHSPRPSLALGKHPIMLDRVFAAGPEPPSVHDRARGHASPGHLESGRPRADRRAREIRFWECRRGVYSEAVAPDVALGFEAAQT
jgi:hypothetical protein